LYGFGHKIYKDSDPRVNQVLMLCRELGYESDYVDKALAIEKAIEEVKGKKLVLNIDGLAAALLLSFGFSSEVGKGLFIIARTPGLVAQAVEEKQAKAGVRRVDEEDIEYVK